MRMHCGAVIDRIRPRSAGNQPGAATKSNKFEAPLYEDQHATLKFHQINKMKEEPDQPSRQARKMQAKNVGYRSCAANDRHVSLIEVMKRSWRFFPLYPRSNCSCDVRAALHRHLGDARERLAIFTRGKRLITDDKNIGVVGNGEVRVHRNATAAIRFSLGALGEFLAKLGGRYPAGPQYGFGREA